MILSAYEQADLLGKIAEGKRIFASIVDSFSKSGPSCMVVTSAARGEGKSLAAAGLAILAAQYTSKQVLAVDCNWFSPSLHTCFGIDQNADIETMRMSEHLLELVRPSGVAGLSIFTAPRFGSGQASTTETQLAADIIRRGRSAYEILIIDASSVFPANRYMIDPVILAKNADEAIMVVLANVTARQLVKRAAMTLISAGVKLAGVIVNQWKNPLAQGSPGSY